MAPSPVIIFKDTRSVMKGTFYMFSDTRTINNDISLLQVFSDVRNVENTKNSIVLVRTN